MPVTTDAITTRAAEVIAATPLQLAVLQQHVSTVLTVLQPDSAAPYAVQSSAVPHKRFTVVLLSTVVETL